MSEVGIVRGNSQLIVDANRLGAILHSIRQFMIKILPFVMFIINLSRTNQKQIVSNLF